MGESELWLNGGFFIFRSEVFDYIERGDDLVTDSFPRLMKNQLLYAHEFTGFFGPMDTFKDKNRLDELYEHGDAPWVVWGDNNVNGRH